MGSEVDYESPCGYYRGHEIGIRGDRDLLFRQRNTARVERDSYKERMEAAQKAVNTLGITIAEIEAKVRALEEQQATNTALNEAALFVGKDVLVYPKDGPNPILLGKVKSIEVVPGNPNEPFIFLRIAARTSVASNAEPASFQFGGWRFEEVG